uniref:C-type lectin domain-containing protein n=1 Tax=Esox lucius TaxID=8010 RepID=A0A6Q2ZPN1_ESOLU
MMFLLLNWSISYCFTGPHGCNQGWQQFGSRCFRFEEILRSWTEAERHCQSLGEHLASVHSWKESRFLETLTVGSPLTWIGGNDGAGPGLMALDLITMNGMKGNPTTIMVSESCVFR